MMKLRSLIYIAFMFLSLGMSAALAQPKNIILFIGDGMGPEQIKAGRLYNGEGLSFESLPNRCTVTTYSADDSITDSAAAATAMATGIKVNTGVISKAWPGDGSALQTILERSQGLGKSVGLVTTASITHATPAAFAAHNGSRENLTAIGQHYLTDTKPNLLFGGAYVMNSLHAASYGYTIIKRRSELEHLVTDLGANAIDADYLVSGQFGSSSSGMPYEAAGDFSTIPRLAEMTAHALQILDHDPDGFFLLVEGGKIDWACHSRDEFNMVHEVLALSESVQVALDWARGRPDTLVIVTADHETGGLTVTADRGPGVIPQVSWTTNEHTNADVDLFSWGPNSEHFTNTIDNTQIFDVMTTATNVAKNIAPIDGADATGLLPTLAWTASPTTRSYDLYLGTEFDAVNNATSESDEFLERVTLKSYTIRDESRPSTTYFWRVDSRDAAGERLTTGEVWIFTTLAALPLPSGSVWKFNDTGTSLGTQWTRGPFDDSAWSSGPAQLGFGDGDERTVVDGGPSNGQFPCVYFRRAFWVDDSTAFTDLTLRLLRDDGAVVYLNGLEIVRSNMPEGTIAYSTLASSSVSAAYEDVWGTFEIDPALLVNGKNVIAVEVHQRSTTSTDCTFDLYMGGTESSARSGAELCVYKAMDGTYAEVISYDVESAGYFTLALLAPDGSVTWSETIGIAAGPKVIVRFLVPGLVPDRTYSFQLQDEAGKIWTANGITVGNFGAEIQNLSLAGLTLSFNSLQERTYDIQWSANLIGSWHTLRTVTATNDQTSVVVEYPDAKKPNGFFRIQVRP